MSEMAGESKTRLLEEFERKGQEALARAESIAMDAATCLRNLFPHWRIRYEAHGESPAWALINKAEEWKADLIIVGAHGYSGLSRFMGSVSQLVLMQAPCSVRVTRPRVNAVPQENLKMIIGVDGSPGAEKALSVVQGREWPLKTEVRVLAALHPHLSLQMSHLVPPDVRATRPVTGLERQAVNQMVESLVDRLNGKQLQVAAHVREGDPKHVLVAEAETWKADCIFLGARGLSPLRRFLLGSVSMAVAARAHCSVEVVR